MAKLYGRLESNDSITAYASHTTYYDREVPGYLELLSIMVQPTTNLDRCRILVDDRQILYDFLVRPDANMLPFGGISYTRTFATTPEVTVLAGSFRPACLFVPSVKIAKGRELAIQFIAASANVTTAYYVRPVGILYTDDEVRDLFGIEPAEWEAREGGIAQGRESVMPFVKYGVNENATRPGTWYDIEELSFRIYANQELEITHIGVVPHANLSNVQIADINRAIVATEQPFTCTTDLNELPFGNADQAAGPFEFPENIRPKFRDDMIRVQIRDNGTSIPANSVIVQVRGIWRTFE